MLLRMGLRPRPDKVIQLPDEGRRDLEKAGTKRGARTANTNLVEYVAPQKASREVS
jgi:hypothetical protein